MESQSDCMPLPVYPVVIWRCNQLKSKPCFTVRQSMTTPLCLALKGNRPGRQLNSAAYLSLCAPQCPDIHFNSAFGLIAFVSVYLLAAFTPSSASLWKNASKSASAGLIGLAASALQYPNKGRHAHSRVKDSATLHDAPLNSLRASSCTIDCWLSSTEPVA